MPVRVTLMGELTALYYAQTFKAQHFIQASQKRGELDE